MATGWGSKTWGASDWGDLSNETVSVSGISLTSTIGTETVQANADVSVTGIELTSTNAGAVAGISFLFEAPSLLLTSTIGDETIGIGVPVTTAGTLTPSIGTATIDETTLTGEGWGRDDWGSFAWGDNFSVQVTGIELTSSIGNENAFADFTFEATGLELTSTQGPISLQIDQDIFVLASEDQLDAEIGSIVQTADANVEITNSAPNFQFTAQGGAALSTDQAKFGVSSLELDGTDDIVDTTTNLDLSSGDFTIDVWIRPNNVSGYKGIWESGTSTKLVSYLLGNTVYLAVGGSTIISNSVTVNANEWTMLSYERVGNNHYVYKNGTLEDTGNTANRSDNGIFSIGESGFGDFNGYIDEFRVSDVARYSGSSFTEPTEAFTFDSDTQFLLHFDGADGSTVIKSADDTLFQIDTSEGTPLAEPKLEVPVTGISLTSTIGDFTLVQSTVEGVTGQELTFSMGDEDAVSVAEATGSEATISIGSAEVIIGVSFNVTGISATISVGQVAVTPWQEIDPGVNNTWTEVNTGASNTWSDVDLAA